MIGRAPSAPSGPFDWLAALYGLTAPELENTGARIVEIDYLDEGTIERAAAAWGDKPLDILINLGGLSPDPKSWQEQSAEMMVEKFRVIAVGPLLTIKHFLPKLEKACKARVVNVSSAFGSIPVSNSFGTCMAYRVTKAALNQGAEGRKVTMVCIEPGFLSTRLTGWDGEDDMDTCIAGMMKLFKGLTPKDHGAFLIWDGTKIPFQNRPGATDRLFCKAFPA
ncbi:NAD(P)-binding protein [Rhypophila sp. PSN 637]